MHTKPPSPTPPRRETCNECNAESPLYMVTSCSQGGICGATFLGHHMYKKGCLHNMQDAIFRTNACCRLTVYFGWIWHSLIQKISTISVSCSIGKFKFPCALVTRRRSDGTPLPPWAVTKMGWLPGKGPSSVGTIVLVLAQGLNYPSSQAWRSRLYCTLHGTVCGTFR